MRGEAVTRRELGGLQHALAQPLVDGEEAQPLQPPERGRLRAPDAEPLAKPCRVELAAKALDLYG